MVNISAHRCKYHPSDRAPLDYALIQVNRGGVFHDFSELPGEDRRRHLDEALAAYNTALDHCPPDAAPLNYAIVQSNRAQVLRDLADMPNEDRKARLKEALYAAWIAVSLVERQQHIVYHANTGEALLDIRLACGADFDELWQSLDLGLCPEWLQHEDEILFKRARAHFFGLRQRIDENEHDIATWQQVVEAGEALLSPQFAHLQKVEWEVVRAYVASVYNSLGNAYSHVWQHEDALVAYDRAINLQPNFAMCHLNKAWALIELGHLDESAITIDLARAWEPNTLQLSEVEAALARARENVREAGGA